MGCDLVLVCSNIASAALGGIDRAADDFAELGERAKKRGIRIGFEALAWGRHINDHRDAWEVVRRADHSQQLPCICLIADDVADDPAAVRNSNFVQAFVKLRYMQISTELLCQKMEASEPNH